MYFNSLLNVAKYCVSDTFPAFLEKLTFWQRRTISEKVFQRYRDHMCLFFCVKIQGFYRLSFEFCLTMRNFNDNRNF